MQNIAHPDQRQGYYLLAPHRLHHNLDTPDAFALPLIFIIHENLRLNTHEQRVKFNINFYFCHIRDCKSAAPDAKLSHHVFPKSRTSSLINFDAASYSYTGSELLNDINLQIAPGAFHFVTGPSGSGKTTFLKICYGELRPNTGAVQIFGQELADMTRNDIAHMRQKIGVIHQDCQFLDHLNVMDNIALPLSVSNKLTFNSEAHLKELLTWVGLTNRARALPPELSGGERQRVALARAVIMSPDIIIADEPTGNIDWEMSQRLLKLLIELNKMGKTVLLASHDLSLIRLAKSHVQARVLRIADKRIRIAGADL